MERKRNESEFGQMARRLGYYAYKWRDRGYVSCPKCHQEVRFCPHCHTNMLLNKAETKPDYLLAVEYAYVEGKAGTDRWAFADSITPNQRRVMVEHEGWLFLEMGTGRAPTGRAAYLIPWPKWMETEEKLDEYGIKSIVWEKTARSKNPTSDSLFKEYRLVWDDGLWNIPDRHVWFDYHKKRDDYDKYSWNGFPIVIASGSSED